MHKATKCNNGIIAENLLSCVRELEPAIRTTHNSLAAANTGENKKIVNASDVEDVAAWTADCAHVAAVEFIHTNSAIRRMKARVWGS